MAGKNKYYRHAHISERKFRQLAHYFTLDLSAADVAQLTGLTRKTVTTIFLKIRRRLAESCEQASLLPSSELKLVMREYLHGTLSEASTDQSHGNDGESFRSFAKKRLQKFHGVSGHTLHLHLKECEWRYAMRDHDLYSELLKLLRDYPL